jgi:hypothetical protein
MTRVDEKRGGGMNVAILSGGNNYGLKLLCVENNIISKEEK